MINLKAVTANPNSYVAIHDRAMIAAANYKRSEIAMLEAIMQVEARQVYFQFELTSLFQYCVELLGLSRHAAYDFITVMRKSAEVPALLEAIRNGSTTVSKARKICSVVTERNSKEWIELTQHCSTRIVEKAVAMANPRVAVVESMKYVSANVLELKLAVSEEWSELLADVKDLMSQKSQRAVSTEEALFQLMADYKRKHNPVAKAERAHKKKAESHQTSCSVVSAGAAAIAIATKHPDENQDCDTNRPVNSSESSNINHSVGTEKQARGVQLQNVQESETQLRSANRKRYIPAGVRHQVASRDRGQCAFVDRHGKRCGSKRWIQTHHVTHFADGGAHTPENLETLCWAHHAMKHRSN